MGERQGTVHFRIFLQQGSSPRPQKNKNMDDWSPFTEDIPIDNELIEMDSWIKRFYKPEQVEILRYPDNSSVVMPSSTLSPEHIQDRIEQNKKVNRLTEYSVDCGLPKHLLVPKGTKMNTTDREEKPSTSIYLQTWFCGHRSSN